jgi:membrane fusion protein, copper/silver efflux system
MIEGIRQRLSRLNPRIVGAFLLVALAAFALGGLLFRSGAAPQHSTTPAEAGAEATTWTCAMHPQIRQPAPGQCPICGMDLIPVASQGSEESRPERITLSERAKALARLRTTTVTRMADPSAEVRLLGRVEPDERTSKTVTAWVGGRIDRLHVRVTGERVRAGQTIATLYSPEVLAAHQDLIAARRQVDRMKAASEAARSGAEAALGAARERLRLLGLPEDRLSTMESAEQPARQLEIRTPFAGTVIERLATEGAYVTTGEALYRIADLSRVWVQLDAYERDLATLRVGQPVRITVESLPGETFEGKITFIDPTLDPQRRTARVRVEVGNPQGRLRPGTFAQAVVQGAAPGVTVERPLVVPHTAPLFTGRRSVVYVEVPNAERPTYEARIVRLGTRAGDVYPVVAGLAEGDRVVTSGAFALDADLQIRGGTSMMMGPDDTEEGPWDQALALPAAERTKLRPLVEAYLQLQDSLAVDDLPSAKAAADSLIKSATEISMARPHEVKEAWTRLAADLRQYAQPIAQASSLEIARGAFEALSAQVKTLLRRFGNPLERPVQVAFCPMAAGGGASWVQAGAEIRNPYFGKSMQTCGDFREKAAPHGYLPRPVERALAPPTHEGHKH